MPLVTFDSAGTCDKSRCGEVIQPTGLGVAVNWSRERLSRACESIVQPAIWMTLLNPGGRKIGRRVKLFPVMRRLKIHAPKVRILLGELSKTIFDFLRINLVRAAYCGEDR